MWYRKALDDLRRVAADDSPGRDIFGHYRSRCNDRIIANGHPGIDHRPAANPHIVANGHRFAIFLAAVTRLSIQRMGGGINMDTRLSARG